MTWDDLIRPWVSIAKGSVATFKRMFSPPITIQYPDEPADLAPRWRGPAAPARRHGRRAAAGDRRRPPRVQRPDDRAARPAAASPPARAAARPTSTPGARTPWWRPAERSRPTTSSAAGTCCRACWATSATTPARTSAAARTWTTPSPSANCTASATRSTTARSAGRATCTSLVHRPEHVAVVGSGPAGLAVGYDLVQMGYRVTVYEREAAARRPADHEHPPLPPRPRGGRQGDPRPGRDGARDQDSASRSAATSPCEELRATHDAVVVAVGYSGRTHAAHPGSRRRGCLVGLDFLLPLHPGHGLRRRPAGGRDRRRRRVCRLLAQRAALRRHPVVHRLPRDHGRDARTGHRDRRRPRGRRGHHAPLGARLHRGQARPGGRDDAQAGALPLRQRGAMGSAVLRRDHRGAVRDGHLRHRPGAADRISWPIRASASTPRADPWATRAPARPGVPGLFLAGDVATGPKTIIIAIGQAHETAVSVHRYLQGHDLTADRRPPVHPPQYYLQKMYAPNPPRFRALRPRRTAGAHARIGPHEPAAHRGPGGVGLAQGRRAPRGHPLHALPDPGVRGLHDVRPGLPRQLHRRRGRRHRLRTHASPGTISSWSGAASAGSARTSAPPRP